MKRAGWAALCAVGMLAFAGQAAAALTFDYTGSIQTWTVDTSGRYQVDLFGAQGGSWGNTPGGLGAHVGGSVELVQGITYTVVVGGRGTLLNGNLSAGGGGGSWVFAAGDPLPLAVAGGGGGANWFSTGTPGPGTTDSGEGSGGVGHDGGGGAGWLESGTDGGPPRVFAQGDFPIGTGGQGRTSFIGGRTIGCDNGYLNQCFDFGVSGGFGGGGGGGWNVGGGGGGYTGGAATMGGSSFLAEGFANIATTAGTRSGNGLVTINFLGVPEPSTWAMLILGFVGLGTSLRRRRAALIGAERA
jgi:hypothetical protein